MGAAVSEPREPHYLLIRAPIRQINVIETEMRAFGLDRECASIIIWEEVRSG